MHRSILFALLLCAYLSLVGCGSETGTLPVNQVNQTGRATFTVTWPEPSRLIPSASNSIRIALMEGRAEIAARTLARPTGGGITTTAFETIRLGNFTATATAHPQIDGTGTVQAQATVPVTVLADNTSVIILTLNSTINRLEAPATLPTVIVGENSPFSVTARNLADEVVLTIPGTFQWQIGDTALATVDALGNVLGVTPGTTNLTVTETESGKSLVITPVRVTTNAVVTVTPSPHTLSINAIQIFQATVTGITNTAVTWSVEEGAAGGVISANGVYVAPATAGTYHIRATSVFDPEKFARVPVTVVSGSASGTIQ